ncbi:MAG: hypothetical protein CSA44_02845 [Gammaproteobacteria bacterium]|nr:MAG: hypothetical protein CSA44_02845 [Gammaproteobacteria bacterium]
MHSQPTVLDTLVYLFDYLVYEKKERPTIAEMHKELDGAGFAQKDIDRAMNWLTHLNNLQDSGADIKQLPNTYAVRQFSREEAAKITPEGQNFIRQLVQIGVLDTRLREIVIHKLMGLDEPLIGKLEINWVVLMALFNRPGQEANTVWLEQLLVNEQNTLH